MSALRDDEPGKSRGVLEIKKRAQREMQGVSVATRLIKQASTDPTKDNKEREVSWSGNLLTLGGLPRAGGSALIECGTRHKKSSFWVKVLLITKQVPFL